MNSTLAALEAAITANPADRTVRLIFADALDEAGDPAGADRATFIRAQIELEAMSAGDPRRPELASQCSDLFAEHWADWWRPVCAAVGQPEPFVPSQSLGGRLKRLLTRDGRAPGWPYAAHPHAWSVESREHAFTAQFIAGFPELLAIHDSTLDTLTGQFRDFFVRAPFHRLRLMRNLSEFEWDGLNGPHLARLTELTLDQVHAEAAGRIRQSPLHGLTSLRVGPLSPVADVVRAVVRDPPWAGLRSLALLGVSVPGAIQTLAADCTLTNLEELAFEIGEVSLHPPIAALTGALGALLADLLGQFFGAPTPAAAADYWPALQALAGAPFFRQLRRLRITDADSDLLERAAGAPAVAEVMDSNPPGLFPDELVNALAGGLGPDKLERLELPASRLSPADLAALADRFGPRFVAS
jgi:uncharacterized protein (TIGR02996 family)